MRGTTEASKSSMRQCALVNDLQRVVSCFTPRLLLPGHEMKGSCKTIFHSVSGQVVKSLFFYCTFYGIFALIEVVIKKPR